MSEQRLAPVHPGEVLLEDFLKPMGISQYHGGPADLPCCIIVIEPL